jgi:osmotically-inducible protein OsmY
MKRLSLLFVFLCLLLTPALPAQADADGKIHDQVMLKLASDVTVRGAALDVDVKSGVVTLRGEVRSDKARERATKLAKKVKGVKNVVNELTVKEN